MTGVAARGRNSPTAIPLEAVVTPLPMRGGENLLRPLFEPLGWKVDVEPTQCTGATVSKPYAR